MAAGQRSHQRIRVSMLLLLGRRFDPAVSIQIPGLSGRLPDRRHGWRGIVRRSEGHAEGPFDSRADRRAENPAEPERTHRARAVIERGPEYSHPVSAKMRASSDSLRDYEVGHLAGQIFVQAG